MLEQVSILAPGLLGGSVAQAVHARGLAKRVVVWARREETREAIAKQPWCSQVTESAQEAVRGASLVVLAPPVDKIVPLIREIVAQLPEGAVVTDVGSVKGELARMASALMPTQASFVGAHPMAGSDKTGWENASPELFEKRVCFVTPLPHTKAGATKLVLEFWEALGMRCVQVSPDLHDEIVANISHLPQIVASTLCASLASKNPEWRELAGGGLRDTTRIAGSDPSMWLAILEHNRDEILRALKSYQEQLQHFSSSLENRDFQQLRKILEAGRHFRQGFKNG